MALDFVQNAANYLEYGADAFGPSLHGASKIAFSALIQGDSYTASVFGSRVIWIGINASLQGFSVNIDGNAGGSRVRVGVRSSGSDSQQTKIGAVNVGTGSWVQIGAMVDIGGDTLTPIADGAEDSGGVVTFGSATYTNGTPESVDRIGMSDVTPVVTSDQFDGRIAHVAFWTLSSTEATFSAADWEALGEFKSPLLVRPRNLVFYEPFHVKRTAPSDMISKITGAINGTLAYADGPPVYMPTRRKLYAIRTATRELSFSTSMARTARVQREGQVNRANVVKRTAKKTTILSSLYALVLGRTAAIDVNIPDLVAQAASAIVSRTVELSMTVIQGTRKFVGSAGLGLLLSPKTRWDRRRPRR